MTTSARPRPVTVTIDDARSVSGLLQAPKNARTCRVLAHGAGAGMSHTTQTDSPSVASPTLRYQFPYMEQGAKRPDVPKLAQATVRAAVAEAARSVPELGLVAGGKSFGGHMTSQAQAASPLPGVRGLVFLGFPRHPPGRPSDERDFTARPVTLQVRYQAGTAGPTLIKTSEILFAGIATSSSSSSP